MNLDEVLSDIEIAKKHFFPTYSVKVTDLEGMIKTMRRQESEIQASRQQAETLEAERDQARAELEEWRFTNKIDELQREVDRYRAAPQQHAQSLPKWIDEAKGKDSFTDHLIAYIEGIHPSQQHAQAAQQFDFATLLMYPQEWDVAAYPTIESAMWEMISCAKIASAVEHERNTGKRVDVQAALSAEQRSTKDKPRFAGYQTREIKK